MNLYSEDNFINLFEKLSLLIKWSIKGFLGPGKNIFAGNRELDNRH